MLTEESIRAYFNAHKVVTRSRVSPHERIEIIGEPTITKINIDPRFYTTVELTGSFILHPSKRECSQVCAMFVSETGELDSIGEVTEIPEPEKHPLLTEEDVRNAVSGELLYGHFRLGYVGTGVFDHLNGHQVDHQKGATYSTIL